MSYRIPSGAGQSEYVEKRSSFLGYVLPINTEEEARAFIAERKKEHRDARHNCWCYRIPDGPERYSDDGEPQGTAGLPMLEVFRKEDVTGAVCVVTRYFGGILLGTGGLLRAYTKAAKDALEAAGITEVLPRDRLTFPCPYPLADRIRLETAAFDGIIENMEYGAEVTFTVQILTERTEAYAARIFDLSSGRIRCEKSEDA